MTKPFYSKAHPGKYILIGDVETSGSTFLSYELTFKKYQAISFGFIVATSDTFEEVASIEFKVKFDPKYEWSAEAEKIHGITREVLEAEGLTPEEAAIEVAEFILEHFGTGKVMFGNHNPYFDIEAMRQLLEPFGVMPDLHHVVLDTSGLGFVAIGKYKSNDVFEFFNGERPPIHDALGDCRMALGVMSGIRGIVNSVLNEQ